MHRSRSTRGWLALLLAAATAAGCGGPGGTDPAGPAPGDLRQQIEKALRDSDPERLPALAAEYQRRLDEHLAGCLKREGFDYTRPNREPPLQPNLGLSDEAFARQYGFGISTLIDVYGRAGQASGTHLRAPTTEKQTPSANEQAYQGALQRCSEAAQRDLGPQPGVLRLPKDSAASTGFQDVSKQTAADPRVVAARKAYETCVARRGFAAASGEELRKQINERAKPFQEAFTARRDELLAAGKDTSDLSMRDVLDAGQMAELKTLQRFELQAAAAHATCGPALRRTVETVQKEYLQRFLDGLG